MKLCYRLLQLIVIFIYSNILVAQSAWFVIHEQADYLPMRSVIAMQPDLRDLFAVGDQGTLYRTHNYGYTWEASNLGTNANLKSIAFRYSYAAQSKSNEQIMRVTPLQQIAIQQIALICGDAGTVIRYDLVSGETTFIDTLTTDNLNTIIYDFFRGRYWLAGDNGFLAFTDDDGQTWQRIILNAPRFDIKKMDFDYSYLLLWGDDGSDVYIKKIEIHDTQVFREVGTDTIPNHTLVNLNRAGGGYSSLSYFITKTANDSSFLWSYDIYSFPNFNYNQLSALPFNNPAGLSIWSDYITGNAELWVTTQNGQIWRGEPNGNYWYLQFEDTEGRALGPILASDNDTYGETKDAVNGVALGSSGLTVFNGFVILDIFPRPGELISGFLDHFIIKFSNVPNLNLLALNTIVKSNFSGVLTVNFYQEPDSLNLVRFEITRPNIYGGIPGERWECTLSNGILPAIMDSNYIKELEPVHFDYSFFPEKESTFEHSPSGLPSVELKQNTTNWVAGFFNQDEFLDLVTYTRDTLIVLMSQNSDNRILKKIYIPGININFNIKKQLKTVDINHDPLPDLLLFDDTQLLLLINSSQVTDINFYVGDGIFNSQNIKDIIPYNEDNNSQTDLLILNNDISVIKNITENLIDPTNQTVLFSNVPNVSKVQIGDIDGDLVSDLVFLDNGAILSRLGDLQFGLTGSYSLDTLAVSDYSDFTLADLDNNPPLEIVCLGSQSVEAISYLQQYFDEMNFIRTLFYFNNINQFETFMAIDDFGGDPFYDYNKILDIGFLKSDSLFIFQNETVNPNELTFSETPVFQKELFQSFDQFFTVDYEADGLPEIALVDRFAGRLNFWKKSGSWLPILSVDSVQKSVVKLSWNSFPEELGTLDFYELEKSRDPYFEDQVEVIDVNDTVFIDHDVWSFEDYWYRVRAVYNDGQFSEISDPVRVQIYREISGNVTGVLADTTLPYMVIGDLFVPRVDSLIILNGVQLAFRENTGMEVYGRLSIRGNNNEEMVNFFERDSLWRGIRLYQNPDTAYFEWFSIHGAKIGLLANERPIKMHLGGIVGCETAMQVEQLDFWMENILIDSVFGGIQSGGMVNGFIKNIDILHAKDFSVLASGVSTDLRIKNAIIWHNLGPVTAADSAKIFIDYSTVDNIGTRVFAQHISKLPPLFLENLENEQFQLDPMSPTIDAGDPNDPFDLEPQPNGGRINQGTLGNTYLATPSLQPRIDAKLMKKDLKAFATGLDSTTLFIKNWGFVELNVDSLVFKKARFDSVFRLGLQDNFTVAPQDSIPLKLWFKPPHRGNFLDSLVIFCNDPHLLAGRYVFEVQGTGLNSKPILLNEPPMVAFVDSLYRFKPQFFDLDGDSVIIHPIILPEWLKLTTNGELAGTPAPSDTGKYQVRLLFDDQYGGIDSLQYVIQVFDVTHPVSLIPVIKAFPLGGPLSKQAAINIIVTVFDSTQNKLTDASKSYHFFGQLFKEGQPEPIEQIDTSGIRNIAFYPLLDGDYKFVLTANKTLVTGQQVEAKTEISFRIKASQKSFARFQWHMMAYPRQKELNWAAFEYADSAAVLYRWDANEKKYFPLTKEETIEPGWAFWLMPLRNITFDLNTLPIASSEQQSSLKINLKKGWNQIGLPWPYYKRWINMRVAQGNSASQLNINQAIADSLIQPAAFWFEQSDEFIGYHVELFDSTTYAKPWMGYWLYANTEVSVFVDNTPEFPFDLTNVTSSTTKLAKIANNNNDWLLNFSLQSEKLKDDFTMVGFTNLPSKPILEPPVFNEFTSLAVTEGEQTYCRLLKPWFDDNKTYAYWDLTVTTSAIEKEHRLSWQQLAGQNKELFAYLVDLDNETMIKLWEKNDYVFTPETNIYHFRLYVSNDQNFKPSIIPLQYSLAQNFPNPFNPTTTIKIGVPETGSKDKISVRVYDVLGKEIRVLFDGHLPAGFHKFEWDGTNATGEAVASGIYFYQLRAGQVSIMKKMVLLR